jgi:rubrerythrin
MSPLDSKDVIEEAERAPISPGSVENLLSARAEFAIESGPVGSVPPPSTVKGVVKSAVEAVKGHAPTVFIDRLAERLAFERTGTRLYQAILVKFDSGSSWTGGPTRSELERFHDDELDHFHLLRAALEELGADPTVMTPAADVIGVASGGLIQVVTDPRTTLPQCLQALLTAELTDNDGWQMLSELARSIGKGDMVERFVRAQQQEAIHLAHVRRWIADEIGAVPMGSLRAA